MSERPGRKRPSPQLFGSSWMNSGDDDSSPKRHRIALPPDAYLVGFDSKPLGRTPVSPPPRHRRRLYSPTTNAADRLPVLDHRLPARSSSSFNTSAIRSSAAPNVDARQPGDDAMGVIRSYIPPMSRVPPSPASRPPQVSQSSSHIDLTPAGITHFYSAPSQPTPVPLSSATLSANLDSFPNAQSRQHFSNTVDALQKSRAALEEILQGLPSYPLASGPLYKVIDAHNDLEKWFNNYAGSLAQNCTCPADVDKAYFFADCKHRSCATCIRKSGQCCKRNQSVFKAFFPQNDVCPICRDADSTMSILVCGHVVCRRCWDRMQRETPHFLATCPVCRIKPAGPVASYEPSITVALDATRQLN